MKKALFLRQFVLFFLLQLCMLPAMAQGFKVTGTVTDASSEPIIGASILEKGTTNGVITDFDGNFTLTVKQGATLEISYVGYKTVTVVANQPTLNVVMQEDSQALEELVVVGYGVQKKSNLTGAISQVKAGDLENRTATDLNQSLQGKTAGVQLLSTSSAPGADSNIRIRGFSSNTTSNPLYVVDGVRVASIANIDPNDIESIEVLKDAASAAIYGAEAGNGVVMVTTKKGKSGDGKISYSFQYAIQSLAKHAEMMEGKEYLDYMVQAGVLQKAMTDTWDGTVTNWCDEMFESAPMQKHNISFQNSGEKGNVYASLNYQNSEGIVKTDKDYYKRITGTINVDYKIKNWLSISSSNVINYHDRSSLAENDQYKSVLRAALALDPCTPNFYKANALPSWMQTLVDNGYKLVTAPNGDYYSISQFMGGADEINPNILIDTNEDKTWGTSIQGNTAFNFSILKGLTFTSRLGYNFMTTTNRTLQQAYYATATRNQDLPVVDMTVRTTKYYQWENFANYLFNIGEHNFTAMLGTSFSANRVAYARSGGKGLNADLPSYAYPDYLSASASSLVYKGDDLETTKLSYFGRLSYDYKNIYMLQFTMRADAADLSILPTAQRWGYFPAVSAGWTVSNEEWFPKETAISSLKLRASWGQNGSIAGLSNFAYANAIKSSGGYSFVPNAGNYTTSSLPSSTGNQNLKWETSEQTDLGLDFSLFNSRLTFGMDYFIKKTKDLIVSGTKPTLTVGNTVSPVNAGNVENKGFEFDLGWKDNIGDLRYSISANLATLSNKVTYLDPSIPRLSGASYNSKTITAFEVGYPVWYFRGYQVDHIDPATGNPLYVGADGTLKETVSTNDMTMIGSAIPDFTYGVTLNLGYKDFDLVVFGQGSQGNDIFSALVKTDRPQANRLQTYYKNAWTEQNPNAQYARIGYQNPNYWQSSAQVFDGSYFKIKQIQLGYTLPKNLLKKTFMSSLRVYMSLDDFFLFTKYPGMDPEASSGTTSALGIDMGSYPSSKKMVFGLNLSF